MLVPPCRRLAMPRSLLATAAFLTLATMTSPASAHWGSLGRHLGCGWGDGYHAANLCAPMAQNCSPAGTETPSWLSPLPPSETLPHPAAPAQFRRPIGPSLFRAPGEGSSVLLTDGPPPKP